MGSFTKLQWFKPDLTVTGFAEATVRSNLVHKFFLPDFLAIFQCCHRSSTTAHLTLMCSFIIVAVQPIVQIHLQPIYIGVNLLSEGNLIKLLQNSLVKTLTDTIGLG